MNTVINDLSSTLNQARSGDTAAFANIVRQYQSLISGVLFSATGDFHTSEDLAQETFLIAWKKLHELRNDNDLVPWLCTIARNLANRSFRQKNEQPSEMKEKAGALSGPLDELLRKEQSELVWSAIGEIPETYRETLVLYYRGGQSVKEIATALDASEESIRQRLVRARKSLKSKLETIIGDILHETAPGDSFTVGVISAITAGTVLSTSQTVLAATAVAGTAGAAATANAAATSATSTGSALTGKTLTFATLCTMFGFLAYFAWLFSLAINAFYTAVRNAPTLRSRRFRTYYIFKSLQYCPAYTLTAGMISGFALGFSLVVWKWIQPATYNILLLIYACSVGVIPGLLIQLVYEKKLRKIVENDLGVPGPRVESYSYAQVERRFFLSLLTNALYFGSLLAFLVVAAFIMGPISDLWFLPGTVFLMFLAAIIGTIYYKLGRYFLEICRTKENFLAAKPLIEHPFEEILTKTTETPSELELWNRAGKISSGSILKWAGFVVFGFWYLSLYSWNVSLLFWFVFIFVSIGLWVAYQGLKKKFPVLRSNTFSALPLYGTILIYVLFLHRLEFGSLSSLLWGNVQTNVLIQSQGFISGTQFLIIYINQILILLPIVGLPITLIQWYKTSRRESEETKSGRDEMIREAIAKFDPNTMNTDEQPIPEAKSFPKIGIYGLGAYTVGIFALLIIGILFPNLNYRKYQLERKGDYTTLIAMEPENAMYYHFRSMQSARRTREERLADANTAIRLQPDLAWAYQQRAELLADIKFGKPKPGENEIQPSAEDMQQALTDCNTAIGYKPNSDSLRETRAKIYEKLGNLDAAVADLADAIRLYQPPIGAFGDTWLDNRIFLYRDRARINELRNDIPSAIEDFTLALRIIEADKKLKGYYAEEFHRKRGELYQKISENEKTDAEIL